MTDSTIGLFKIISTIVFLVFGFYISDFKNKNTKPLINQPWLTIMRIAYPLSPLCYLFFLWTLNELNIFNYFALAFMFLGTIIVILAKRELGANHSWTGYSTTNVSTFTRTGIYKYVRHPLYLGIIIAVIGTAFLVLPRISINFLVSSVYIVGMIFTFVFISISSKKETEYLKEKFGNEFVEYIGQVPAFFPKPNKSKFKVDSQEL